MSGSLTLDEVILDASTSNIAISDGTDTLAINGDGSLNATVTATDLDIRDLVNTQDSVAIGTAFRGEQQDYISYACSKGGMISLTKTMSRSFGETDNIVAISIAPGFVRTEMAQSFIDKHGEDNVKQGITLDRLTEPKDISPIVSLIVSGKIDHSTGSTIDVNGGSFLR